MKQYKIISVFLCLLGFSTAGLAQVTIGSSTSPPAKAAILDLKTVASIGADNVSADKGLILPRAILSSLTSLEPFIASATEEEKRDLIGMKVYNMNDTAPFSRGVYVWNGNNWTLHRQATEVSSVALEASNALSKPASAIRLGGTLTEATTINQANHNLAFEQTTGSFSVNNPNALVVSGTNTGIGVAPSAGSRLTVSGNMLIRDSLKVKGSTSAFRQTAINDSLWIRNPAPSSNDPRILKNIDAAGNTQWVPYSDLPDYNVSEYREATITSGLNMTVGRWNTVGTTGQEIVPGFEIRLTPGLWLVYFSVVVEPIPVLTTAAEPIWGRFRFDHWTGTAWAQPAAPPTAGNVQRIGALEVSDRVYPNIAKNVIKGHLILRVNGTERLLALRVGSRATPSGYQAFPASVTNVLIGDPNEPMNYVVALPL